MLGAARLDWPSAAFWMEWQRALLGALAVTAAVPVVQVAISKQLERTRLREVERQREIEAALTGSLSYLVKHAGATFLDTGVQVFEVVGWRPTRQRQVRVAKVRLRPVPTSGVTWTQDKGVIGKCWATHATQYEDLETYFAAYLNADKSQWDALSSDTRFGLTYEDHQRLKDKYGVIAAVPIKDKKDHYIGCITADVAPRHGAGEPLVKDEILYSLASTADVVAGLLKR